jgi:hypothetical protein
MNKTLLLLACMLLLLAAITLALLAVSYHRITVVEGISGNPISGAYISVERASGEPEEVGQTGADGKLTVWTSPFPLPRIICAQSTFHPMGCVRAISLKRQVIELAVPAFAP